MNDFRILILLFAAINCLINDQSYESCSYNIIFNEANGYSIGTDFIPSESSLCFKRKNENYDKNIHKCCYEEFKKSSETEKNKRCAPLKIDEYNKLEQYISELKESASFDFLNIICEDKNSNSFIFLSLSIYFFILLF